MTRRLSPRSLTPFIFRVCRDAFRYLAVDRAAKNPKANRRQNSHAIETLESRSVPAVAIIDSGFGGATGYDFADRDHDTTSLVGHASHVAEAVRSVAPGVELIDLKVVSDDGSTNFRRIEEALQWVVVHAKRLDIDVVNLSIGASAYQDVPVGAILEDEFAALNHLGVIVVASAGNAYSGEETLAYPAVSPQVLPVMALGSDVSGLASYSQRSSAALAAPTTRRGTSFAAPYVAGAIQRVSDALGKRATREAILDHVWATAGRTQGGYRAIDLERALESLLPPAPSPPLHSGAAAGALPSISDSPLDHGSTRASGAVPRANAVQAATAKPPLATSNASLPITRPASTGILPAANPSRENGLPATSPPQASIPAPQASVSAPRAPLTPSPSTEIVVRRKIRTARW